MNTEEKAKAYDEAIKLARDYYKANLKLDRVDENLVLEDIFPELKESKDERVRKEIIETFKILGDGKIPVDINYADIFTWLEKQGEQKSTDRYEPKFKVGDWVISKYMHLVMQILNNDNGSYKTVETDGTERNDSYDFIERNFKLWTIQDAKDGDILATDDGICIFDGTVEEGKYPFAYCGITERGFGSYDVKLPFSHDNNVHPATKEQCDALMKAMTDTGYAFDFEKKELKKIEQKPAWSEEDETKMRAALAFIKSEFPKKGDEEIMEDTIEWLKSLKQRIGWKPSDEQIVVLELASKYERVFTPEQIDILIDLKEQLKKLKVE